MEKTIRWERRRGERGSQVKENVLVLLAGGDGDLLEPDDGGDLGAGVLIIAGVGLRLLVSTLGIGAGHDGDLKRV